SITPTPFGEGKTTAAIGLAQGCWRIGVKSMVALRQSSMGPTFGIKGGGAGGGRSTLEPMVDMNLHFTGDAHAVTSAHNACAALLDNHLHQGNALGIETVTWPRVIDMNDRALRQIEIGQGAKNGPERETGYQITAASEIMSILALATDYVDLRTRLGRIVVGWTAEGNPVTAEDIDAAGAMAVLMKDALSPNLVQTQEGGPALVHAGPFGNVALGCSSIIADQIGLSLADVVITEAGFGSDLGFEKFCDVKCTMSGLWPDLAMVVVTIRALKAQSGRYEIKAGRPLDVTIGEENLTALDEGLHNLADHLANVARFGIPAVVAINRYPTDTEAEIQAVMQSALANGAAGAAVADVYGQGGADSEELARLVMSVSTADPHPVRLYEDDDSLPEKISKVASAMYGVEDVELSQKTLDALARYSNAGYDHLPICVAKSQYSFSGNAGERGKAGAGKLVVRDLLLYAGAGYIVPVCGAINLMPGLGKTPGSNAFELLPDGAIVGVV
ncbi:MAG: formate--tetrahydrofolate ligase, partial [Thermomicrobiales bacterium]|nr:formate--tetrahydrofolate ligase [Thermomicrobiales bacterium]